MRLQYRSYRLLVTLLLLSFAISWMPGAANAQEHVPAATFDLRLDEDLNGLPDALESEVQRVESVATSLQAANANEQNATFSLLAEALSEMDNKLPYSAQTRDLQSQLSQLQSKLLDAEDETTVSSIRQEMAAIDTLLWQDENYRIVIQSLEKMLVDPQTGIGPVVTPKYAFRQYLPAIVGGAGESITSVIGEDSKTTIPSIEASSVDRTAVNWSRLARGDMMLIRSGWLPWNTFLYCMWYCHAGTYNGSNFVYESNPDGVRLKSLNDWKKSGQYVGLAYNRYTSYAQDRAALDKAIGKWKSNGTTKYNYNFADKGTDSKLYCSQLVWKIHKFNNYDLDSNNWAYLTYIYARWGVIGYTVAWYAVAPDEVARDGDVYIYSSSWN